MEEEVGRGKEEGGRGRGKGEGEREGELTIVMSKLLPRAKFRERNQIVKYSDSQDGRMPRQMSSGEEWRRQQQSNRNGYLNNNLNRLPTSSSAPSLAEMASGEQSPDMTFFDKPYAPKSGFQRKSRFSFNEDASKEFG